MSSAPLPVLRGERIYLRHAEPGNEAATVRFFDRNRAHFRPWDPPIPADFYSLEYWAGNLKRALDDFHADRAVRFDIVRENLPDAEIVGRIGFSQIFRGPFQSSMLGYQIDAAHEGQGLMFEALREAIGYMFQVKLLHRIQANHLPENERSARLLQRLGFQREGLSRDYLFIGDRWRDHVLNALINPVPEAIRVSRS